MRFLITDFKRALSERTFFASLLIGIACMSGGLGIYLSSQENYSGTQAFLSSQSLILPFIAPLLAALPYANMSMLEDDCGYKRLMMSKNKMKTYDFIRWLITSTVAGIALVLPLVALAVGCSFITPYTDKIYIIRVLLLDFAFGFSYGSIAYGLTFVNKKRYIPTVAPQVIYLLFIYAFPYLGLENYYPPLSFSPWLLEGYGDFQHIVVQFLVLNGLAFLLMVGRKIWDSLQQIRCFA